MEEWSIRRFIVAAAFVLAAGPGTAQDAPAQDPPAVGRAAVVGMVIGEDGRGLGTANVALRSAADSTIVTGTLTTAEGRFRIANIPPGRYFLEVRYVGYRTARSAAIELAAGETAEAEPLRLAVAAVELDRIDVRGERAPAAFAADRSIYSTADMPALAGGGATEALRTIPELEVDIDGAVTLDGATPEVHINGRPAPMEGEAMNVFLEQFPADRIERIEVIPNPSARYAAEGAGGIINIVLKEDVDLGLSGNVFANIGTRGRSSGGGQLAYQEGDLTLFGGAFLRHSDRETSTYDLRQNLAADPTTFLRQDAWSDRSGLAGSVDLTAQYAATDRALLWTEGRVFRMADATESLRTTTHMDASRDPTLRYDRRSRSDDTRLSTDLAAGYRYRWEPRRHELELEIEYETGRRGSDERSETTIHEALEEDGYLPPELTFDDGTDRDREITAEADYVRPLGDDGRLELGYRARLDDRGSARERRFVDAGAADDVVEDLGWDHRRVYNSAYITASRPFGGFGAQLGLRAERADSRFTIPTGETFRNRYISLFPSANLSYDLGGGGQLRASYSRRVRRPSARILNPTDRSNDPLNRQVGNPEIDPQYTHSFRFDARYSGSAGTLRLAPFYRRTEGDWERIKTVDARGVSTLSWENLASTQSYGARLTASLRPLNGWSGYASVRGQREVRDASNLPTDYSGSAIRWSTRLNVNARLSRWLAAQTMVSWSPPGDVAQGRIGSRLMTHVGARQQLFDGRASIRIALVDPFDLYGQSFETRDPTHVQIGSSDRSMRSARISFSYTFGADPDRFRRGGGEDESVEESGIRE